VQTQEFPETKLTDRDIAAAKKELAKLRDAADHLEAEAQALVEADEASEAAALATLVMQRRARRARAAADEYEAGEYRELRRQHARQRAAADAARLKQCADELDAVVNRAGETLAAAIAALDALPSGIRRFARDTQELSCPVSAHHTSIEKRLAEVYSALAGVTGVRLYFIDSQPGLIKLEAERTTAPKG
jgi:uncharacterized protein YPO0396